MTQWQAEQTSPTERQKEQEGGRRERREIRTAGAWELRKKLGADFDKVHNKKTATCGPLSLKEWIKTQKPFIFCSSVLNQMIYAEYRPRQQPWSFLILRCRERRTSPEGRDHVQVRLFKQKISQAENSKAAIRAVKVYSIHDSVLLIRLESLFSTLLLKKNVQKWN